MRAGRAEVPFFSAATMRSAGIVLSIGQHQATNTCFHARVDLVRAVICLLLHSAWCRMVPTS